MSEENTNQDRTSTPIEVIPIDNSLETANGIKLIRAEKEPENSENKSADLKEEQKSSSPVNIEKAEPLIERDLEKSLFEEDKNQSLKEDTSAIEDILTNEDTSFNKSEIIPTEEPDIILAVQNQGTSPVEFIPVKIEDAEFISKPVSLVEPVDESISEPVIESDNQDEIYLEKKLAELEETARNLNRVVKNLKKELEGNNVEQNFVEPVQNNEVLPEKKNPSTITQLPEEPKIQNMVKIQSKVETEPVPVAEMIQEVIPVEAPILNYEQQAQQEQFYQKFPYLNVPQTKLMQDYYSYYPNLAPKGANNRHNGFFQSYTGPQYQGQAYNATPESYNINAVQDPVNNPIPQPAVNIDPIPQPTINKDPIPQPTQLQNASNQNEKLINTPAQQLTVNNNPIQQQIQAAQIQNGTNQQEKLTSIPVQESSVKINPIPQQVKAQIQNETDRGQEKTYNTATQQQLQANAVKNNTSVLNQAPSTQNRVQNQEAIKPTFTTINDVFNMLDKNKTGKISVSDFRRVIAKVNKNLNRSYGEGDLQMFFNALNKSTNDTITFNEFLRSFEFLDAFEKMQK